MSVPVVTVISPTWNRHTMLLRRAIPSVQQQGHPYVEHIVVSDGPDPWLRDRLAQPWLDGWRDLWYLELPAHPPDPHYGIPARLAGLKAATGEYVTYLDDDDSLRSHHCHVLAAALDAHPEAGFAVSRMASHAGGNTTVIGHGELACGNVGTPMIMHRRELTGSVVTWGQSGQFEDWELVQAWLQAGVGYVRVDDETADVWPSLFRGAGPDPEPEPGTLPGEPARRT